MPAAPDPKDCANPICSSKSDMFKKMTGSSKQKPAASTSKLECPLDRDELGQNTWSLVSDLINARDLLNYMINTQNMQLHSMAAYYPEKPTAAQRSQVKSFMAALSELYPCTHCAEDFRQTIKDHPVRSVLPENMSFLCLTIIALLSQGGITRVAEHLGV
jgi:FAD-linked sulfhydryl oxidase